MRIVRSGGYRASYSEHRKKRIGGCALSLQNLKQQDSYSCGYLAALTVARFYNPKVCDKEVLLAVRPVAGVGTSQRRVINGLWCFGISAQYRDDLTVFDLHAYVSLKVPVIVSVWPDYWPGDHWTVVQGFDRGKVYLTNHYSMTLDWFQHEWVDNWEEDTHLGAGLICTRS